MNFDNLVLSAFLTKLYPKKADCQVRNKAEIEYQEGKQQKIYAKTSENISAGGDWVTEAL